MALFQLQESLILMETDIHHLPQVRLASFELDALLALQRLVRTDRRALGMALNALSNSTATPLTQAPRAWAWAVKAFSSGSKAIKQREVKGG